MSDKKRCDWTGSDPKMVKYHDEEWGVPVHEDNELFEFLILEGAQAGLSWSSILNRREGYQKAFINFDVIKVAQYSESDYEHLLLNPGIIRNKLKIKSTISNAKQFIQVQEEFGSFNQYIWGFIDHQPIQNQFKSLSEIPALTDISTIISKDLKKRGFSFVGPTIIYAFMQSTGMVNDHLMDCYRYPEIIKLSR